MAGLFDTFTIAKRGLNVQQSAINTTSHNIANANTEGYSRQRSVAETTKPFGGMSRFDTSGVGQIGTGAEVTSIQRIRNYFIDFQVRSETGTLGYYESQSDILSKVESVFSEPSDNGIQTLMTNTFKAFSELSKPPVSDSVKKVAITQASALADAINYSYNQLDKLQVNNQDNLKDNILDVNSTLNQINELNKQIAGVSAVGQTPNDLMDKRDKLIDDLSYNFGIEIGKDKFETVNLSSTEYKDSFFVKSDPNDTGYSRLSSVKKATVTENGVQVEYYPLGNEKGDLKTFTIKMNGTTPQEIQAKQDLAHKLNNNKVIIGDKDGIVGTETKPTLLPAPLPAEVTIPADGVTISADSTGVITLSDSVPTTIGTITTVGNVTTITPQNITMTLKTDGTIEVNDGVNPVSTMPETGVSISTAPNVSVIKKADGTIEISTDTMVTEVNSNGTITTPEALTDFNKKIFQTYEYERDVNTVDNKYVKGDIAGNQKTQDLIERYKADLDRLAATLAYTVNAIQTGSVDSGTTTQGLQNNAVFTTESYKLTSADIANLTKEKTGPPAPSAARLTELNTLIAAGLDTLAYKAGDGTITTSADIGITAANIRINSKLLENVNLLNASTTSTSGVGDGKRADAFARLNTLTMDIVKVDDTVDLTKTTRKDFLAKIGVTGFTDTNALTLSGPIKGSTLNSYYTGIINEIAVNTKEASRQVENQNSILGNLEEQRMSESGVSLDEEMTDLIQFQHAYQANAKMISTIDELLDVVINGLKK